LNLALGQPKPAVWRALWTYSRPHKSALLWGGLLSLIGSLAGLAQPLAAKAIVDALGAGASVMQPLVFLTLLVVAGAAVATAGYFVLERTAESVVLAARRQLVRRILWLRMPEVEKTLPGDLMSRVTSDTTLLRQVTTIGLVQAVTQSLTLIGIIVMMGIMDMVQLAVTIVVLIVMGGAIGITMPKIQKANKAVQESVGKMGAAMERILGAFRTVKASGAELREAATLEEAATQAWSEGVRVAKWNAVAGMTAWLAVQVSFLAVLGVGGARVAEGAIPVSTLVAFLLYLFYLLGPITELVNAATQFQAGSAALERIGEVERLAIESPVSPPVPSPAARSAVQASVAFRNVIFRYRDEHEPVHRGVTFELPARGMTAFVGPSGAGKTTVFSLIERFYEPESGTVLVDGRDVRDWPLHELRATIGYVEQDAPVLAGTLRDNLRFAAPEVTDEEILEVVALTRLDGLLARLPDGLDTVVGHRGSTLSGGERQRVAIARALLRQPRLLLLDEATSQLDAVNELALRETVADLAKRTTVLVVAHRLSTVTMADRIVVMDAGEVRAVGTHDELVAQDGLYRELAATQLLTASPDGNGLRSLDPGPKRLAAVEPAREAS
jgi:ABC-type multidrug transport system fused ATPase/permease subunit